MYLLSVYFENGLKSGAGRFTVLLEQNRIQKWTLVPDTLSQEEILPYIALSILNTQFSKQIIQNTSFLHPKFPLHLEVKIIRHPETDGNSAHYGRWGRGALFLEGGIRALKQNEFKFLDKTVKPLQNQQIIPPLSRYFLLGYGPFLTPHDGTDDHDFNNPFLRNTRFHSLFNPSLKVTDPVSFLHLLWDRGQRRKRLSSLNILKRICHLCHEHLGIDTARWLEKDFHPDLEWQRLPETYKCMLILILDASRHLLAAFPKESIPLEMPGVVLLHRPDLLCGSMCSRFICLLDQLLPRMQFIFTGPQHHLALPSDISARRLELPTRNYPAGITGKKAHPRGAVLLIQVDGRLPNVALMKLSRHYKQKGKIVVLEKGVYCQKRADQVYASAIFNSKTSQQKVKMLRNYYGDALIMGGSGIDLTLRLPAEIEDLTPDYSLYPELQETAIGFMTRGCPNHCSFCVVPKKEGPPRQVSELDQLLYGGRRKLILLDDNILSHPKAPLFLEEMVRRGIQVNFNQTLDLHYLTQELADLLGRIHATNARFTRRNYHFSLNSSKNLSMVFEKYRMLKFTPKDNVEFVCMYGFNTTLEEDVERFRFLRSLPGAYVFVQEYQPILGGPAPRLDAFFGSRADELIDELVQIIFPQNMKSMEKYYRWLSKYYAITFGKLNRVLVDAIFRYNNRHQKPRYIETLAGIKR